MTDKMVIVLLGEGENDAVRGLMTEFGNAVASLGLSTVHVSLEPAELQYAVNEMAQGNVRFALSWLGVGQELSVQGPDRQSVNCWEYTRVPLVKIHADSPAYFSDRHRNLPANAVNLYMAREFLHFRNRWMPGAMTLAGLIPPWPMAAVERDRVDLKKRRSGKLVFLKNGNSPAQLRAGWEAGLSPTLAKLVSGMADDIRRIGLKPGALNIGDFVGAYMESCGMDQETMLPLIPFFTAQLDDYLRRVKSEMISVALLDFPVIVQGGHWEHVDFSGRKAELRPGQDFTASHRIFMEELGIVDMSPNMDTEPHERVMRAAGSYATVLTNRQSWLAREFPDCADLAFEFDPESIRHRVADMLAHPDRYLELGVAFGERFREIYPREAFARRVVEMADLAALQCAEPKPQIQNFFIWPGTVMR